MHDKQSRGFLEEASRLLGKPCQLPSILPGGSSPMNFPANLQRIDVDALDLDRQSPLFLDSVVSQVRVPLSDIVYTALLGRCTELNSNWAVYLHTRILDERQLADETECFYGAHAMIDFGRYLPDRGNLVHWLHYRWPTLATYGYGDLCSNRLRPTLLRAAPIFTTGEDNRTRIEWPDMAVA